MGITASLGKKMRRFRKLVCGFSRGNVFLLPHIEECVDALDGNLWFSKLDANSANWQVKLDDESRTKTASTTRRGLVVWVPFGLFSSPATFSRSINLVLSELNWKTVLAFLDEDI